MGKPGVLDLSRFNLGLGWDERFLDGSAEAEEAFFNQAILDIHEIQHRNKTKSGAADYMRAQHAKIQAGITNAELIVCDDLPRPLRRSFFQPGKRLPASVRFSNASGLIQADTVRDLRGLALRVENHDFLATNAAASHARDARQFMAFARAASGSKLMLLPRLFWAVGPREAIRMLRTISGQTARPVKSLATESYWSRAPYAWGDYALKFQISPISSFDANVPLGPSYLKEDLVLRLLREPIVFDFQVQFFLNEQLTPIEDGCVEWASPILTVAKLVIPQQDLTTELALAAQLAVDGFQFNPWTCTELFRPLGGLNRARRRVYPASSGLRTGRDVSTRLCC